MSIRRHSSSWSPSRAARARLLENAKSFPVLVDIPEGFCQGRVEGQAPTGFPLRCERLRTKGCPHSYSIGGHVAGHIGARQVAGCAARFPGGAEEPRGPRCVPVLRFHPGQALQ